MLFWSRTNDDILKGSKVDRRFFSSLFLPLTCNVCVVEGNESSGGRNDFEGVI